MDIAQKLQQTVPSPTNWAWVRVQLLVGVFAALGLLLVVSKLTTPAKNVEQPAPNDSAMAATGEGAVQETVAPPAAVAATPPAAEPPAERFIEARARVGAEAASDLSAFAALIAPSANALEHPEPASAPVASVPSLATAVHEASETRILLAEALNVPDPPAPVEPAPVSTPLPADAAATVAAQTTEPADPANIAAPVTEVAAAVPAMPDTTAAKPSPEPVLAALIPVEAPAPETAKHDDSLSFDDLLNITSPDTHAELHAAATASTPLPAPEAAAPQTESSDVVVEVKPDGTIAQGEPQSQEDLVKEMKQLQEKFDQLQETVNIVVTQMMSDVETENAQLRAEVKRLQARDQAGLLASTAVPRPGGELLNQLSQEARDTPPEELEKDPLPPAAFAFNVMKEWGRDPEAAKQLGGKVVTLKGVIGTVPLGSTREDIEQLGRDLRAQYAEYDNINVEVFDDPVAAQAFVDLQTIDPDHHVLSVSKYSATNHDAITFYDGGEATDLLPQAATAIAQELPLAPADNTATQDPPQDAPEVSPAQDAPEAAPMPAPTQNDSPKSIHNKKGRRPGK